MRVKNLIIVLLFPLLADLVVSCCECVEPQVQVYTHCNLSVENIDNSGPGPTVSSSDTINKQAFGLMLNIQRKIDFCEVGSSKGSFGTAAYATSCNCPPEQIFNAIDSIVSLEIYSIHKFNPDHNPGEAVTQYFKFYNDRSFYNVEHYINMLNSTIFSFKEGQEFNLLLINPPEISGLHQFEVCIELSDGREFKSTSPEVYLK